MKSAINYKIVAFKNINTNVSTQDIQIISQKIKLQLDSLFTKPLMQNKNFVDALRLEKNILVDGLTYMVFVCASQGKPFFEFINDLIILFLQENAGKRITFQAVIDFFWINTGLSESPPEFASLIHEYPAFQSAPELRTQLDFFINRGKFDWHDLAGSNFKDYLYNNQKTALNSDEPINCWEAILYSMIRSGAINKDDLKSAYKESLDLNNAQHRNKISEKLTFLFNWQKAKDVKKIKDFWTEEAGNKTYFLMASTLSGSGLDHNWISIPGKNEDLLRALILLSSEKEVTDQYHFQLYSNWSHMTDSRLGTIEANHEDYNDFILETKTVKAVSFDSFVMRIKQLVFF